MSAEGLQGETAAFISTQVHLLVQAGHAGADLRLYSRVIEPSVLISLNALQGETFIKPTRCPQSSFK